MMYKLTSDDTPNFSLYIKLCSKNRLNIEIKMAYASMISDPDVPGAICHHNETSLVWPPK